MAKSDEIFALIDSALEDHARLSATDTDATIQILVDYGKLPPEALNWSKTHGEGS